MFQVKPPLSDLYAKLTEANNDGEICQIILDITEHDDISHKGKFNMFDAGGIRRLKKILRGEGEYENKTVEQRLARVLQKTGQRVYKLSVGSKEEALGELNLELAENATQSNSNTAGLFARGEYQAQANKSTEGLQTYTQITPGNNNTTRVFDFIPVAKEDCRPDRNPNVHEAYLKITAKLIQRFDDNPEQHSKSAAIAQPFSALVGQYDKNHAMVYYAGRHI